MAMIGYACATEDRADLAAQLDVLRTAGCSQYAVDYLTSSGKDRMELDATLAKLQPGDRLVVQNFTRAASSQWQLLQNITRVADAGAFFVSVEDKIDTGGAGGKKFLTLIDALQRFDCRLTATGFSGKRPRGRSGGRKPVDQEIYRRIEARHADRDLNIVEFCKELNISRGTFYKYSNQIAAESVKRA